MKLRDLKEILKQHGYVLVRSNAHLIYSNGFRHVAVPNHNWVHKHLASRIVKEL